MTWLLVRLVRVLLGVGVICYYLGGAILIWGVFILISWVIQLTGG